MYIHNIKKVNYRRESEQEGEYISNKGDLSQEKKGRHRWWIQQNWIKQNRKTGKRGMREGGERENEENVGSILCSSNDNSWFRQSVLPSLFWILDLLWILNIVRIRLRLLSWLYFSSVVHNIISGHVISKHVLVSYHLLH